ncbi:MAG: ATP-binding cassette domain-containing protein [Cyclobacteriaceae bacterium]|nr:ATP-binding cassette domain-containing protein [Cytophagales bacterium]MCZ8329430.1 ATP-binding cassette domain-containing protein [Cyclobacteriaceae bacterium]
MIEIRNLKKNLRNFELQVAQLSILSPELLVIKGNNGSGKTTFVELLLDLVKKDDGEILLFGKSIYNNENWSNSVNAFLGEGFLIGYLTPLEYLNFIAFLRKVNFSVENLYELGDFIDSSLLSSKSKISKLSKGQQYKIGILGALIGAPKLIIFDEPMAHLDDQTKSQFVCLIEKYISSKEAIIVLTDHGNSFSELKCKVHELGFENGKIVSDKNINEVKAE